MIENEPWELSGLTKCKQCNEFKLIPDFYPSRYASGKDICKTCCAKQARKTYLKRKTAHGVKQREWRAKTGPGYHRDRSRKHLLRTRYGMTLESFEALLRAQGFACPVCECDLTKIPEKRRHVDHCHTTGAVRGILCANCNAVLGHAKDSIRTLENAARYLGKFALFLANADMAKLRAMHERGEAIP